MCWLQERDSLIRVGGAGYSSSRTSEVLGESTHGERWPEGCHEEPESSDRVGSAWWGVGGSYRSAALRVDGRARSFLPDVSSLSP